MTSKTVFCLKTSLALLTVTTVRLSRVLESPEFPFWWKYKPVRAELWHEAPVWGLGVSPLCSTVCRACLWRKHTAAPLLLSAQDASDGTGLKCQLWSLCAQPLATALPRKATYSLKVLVWPPLVTAEQFVLILVGAFWRFFSQAGRLLASINM